MPQLGPLHFQLARAVAERLRLGVERGDLPFQPGFPLRDLLLAAIDLGGPLAEAGLLGREFFDFLVELALAMIELALPSLRPRLRVLRAGRVARSKSAGRDPAPRAVRRVPLRGGPGRPARSRRRVSCSASAWARTCVISIARVSSVDSRSAEIRFECHDLLGSFVRAPVVALRSTIGRCETWRRDRPRARPARRRGDPSRRGRFAAGRRARSAWARSCSTVCSSTLAMPVARAFGGAGRRIAAPAARSPRRCGSPLRGPRAQHRSAVRSDCEPGWSAERDSLLLDIKHEPQPMRWQCAQKTRGNRQTFAKLLRQARASISNGFCAARVVGPAQRQGAKAARCRRGFRRAS